MNEKIFERIGWVLVWLAVLYFGGHVIVALANG